MRKAKRIIATWAPFAVVISAFCLLAYTTVQQAERQGLNDPQIQMAEDSARALDSGAAIDSVTAGPKVEMSRSLAAFLDVYDPGGSPIAGSGLLNGQLPDFPQGALESARGSGENRVTWQPAAGVRVASVVVPYHHGFVVAGRNMREVELRESQTALLAGLAWLLALGASFLAVAGGQHLLAEE